MQCVHTHFNPPFVKNFWNRLNSYAHCLNKPIHTTSPLMSTLANGNEELFSILKASSIPCVVQTGKIFQWHHKCCTVKGKGHHCLAFWASDFTEAARSVTSKTRILISTALWMQYQEHTLVRHWQGIVNARLSCLGMCTLIVKSQLASETLPVSRKKCNIQKMYFMPYARKATRSAHTWVSESGFTDHKTMRRPCKRRYF